MSYCRKRITLCDSVWWEHRSLRPCLHGRILGYDTVLVWLKHVSYLQKNTGSWKKVPRIINLIWFRCDVSNQEEVVKLASKVTKEVGDVTVLVNNAGIMPCHPLRSSSPEEIRKIFDINVFAHLWVSKGLVFSSIFICRWIIKVLYVYNIKTLYLFVITNSDTLGCNPHTNGYQYIVIIIWFSIGGSSYQLNWVPEDEGCNNLKMFTSLILEEAQTANV